MNLQNRDVVLVYDALVHLAQPMHVQKCPFTRITSAALPLASSGGFATTCLEMPTTGHAAFAILQPSNMPIWGVT
jgi:hypothetical protein